MNDRIITRRDRRRYERHTKKQALKDDVRAVGGGDVEDWCDVTGEYPTPLTRENGGAGE